MNKTKRIWGVVCLIVAAILVVLIMVLPSESFLFQVGDENLPWVPIIIIAIIGIVLLGTSTKKSSG